MQNDIYHNQDKQFYVLRITDEHIPELKKVLGENLIEMCYGAKNQLFDPNGVTYTKACKAIITLIEYSSTEARKYGAIAEMLMHVIVPMCLGPDFQSISLLLALQDRNVKHGFDLNFAQRKNKLIWYGEVKSGNEQKRSELLYRAYSGMKTNFINIDNANAKDNTSSKWDAAKHEVLVKFLDKDALPLHKILSDDQNNNIKNSTAGKRNAIFMTVNYGNTNYDSALDTDDIEHIQDIARKNGFDHVIIIAAHKKIFSDIIDFLQNGGK